jgi:class 3 adenylate cyclase
MASPQWCFADFRLDPDNACLWCGTQPIALTPKAFEVLHYLVTHPDRLVTKDTLLDAVWPETAVSDAVVRIAIGEVRRALGDTAQASRYIATVQRRGYRFVAPVVEHAEAVPGPTGAPPLETPDTPHYQEGVPRTPTLPPPEAERRHLTVLFCDLVGSTALTGRLDPEDYREVVRAYHQICAEVLQRFDGYLAQYLGDGVLGYFGYPVAHEDDAQRAIRAGLGLLDALPTLLTHPALPPGEPVAVRLGVHTGLVVMGDVGAGARHEPLALGETPNIAARLQHLAEPNTLVISAATQQLVAGYFRCKALGAHMLPGLAQPLEVYRVLGASGAQSRLEVAATHGLTPLVGRAQEVGLLMACWTRHRGYGTGRDPGGRGRHWQIASGPGAQRARCRRGPCVAGMPGITLLSAYRPVSSHRAVGTASAAPGARGDRRTEGAATGGVLGTAWPATSRDRAAVCSPPVPPVACHLCPCASVARAAAAADLARAPGAPAASCGRAAAPPGHGRPALGRSFHA